MSVALQRLRGRAIAFGRKVDTSALLCRYSSSSTGSADASSDAAPVLKKTPLYDFHVAHGGKMVPFAGYSMPVQYGDSSIPDSHHFTRKNSSIFDVSHMVQHIFQGPKAVEVLERLTPSSVGTLAPLHSTLSAFLWPGTGGIVDDTMITRIGDDTFHVVTNAGCREKDIQYLEDHIPRVDGAGKDVWQVQENAGILAIQGPHSCRFVQELVGDQVNLAEHFFGTSRLLTLSLGPQQRKIMLSRGGYTGEDGFELSLIIPPGEPGDLQSEMTEIVERLMKIGGKGIRLAGLGARDTLRLEAGMCLYGHDLDDTTTPVEAALSWIIPPERREKGGFFGAEVIIPQLTTKKKGGQGVERRRVGFLVEGAPAREGHEIVTKKKAEQLGVITSGAPSLSLNKYIAMGYIKEGFHMAGTKVDIMVRKRKRAATVVKMPFYPTKYYRNPKVEGKPGA